MKQIKLFGTFILVMLSIHQLFSQKNIFVKSEVKPTELSSDQLKIYNKLDSNPNVLEVHLIHSPDLRKEQKDGRIRFELPDTDCEVICQYQKIENKFDGSFFWYGHTISERGEECPCDDAVGEVTFGTSGGNLFGIMSIHEKTYRLTYLGEFLSAISIMGVSRLQGM